ncbi:serine/threonine-protein kinase [Saccharothrix xinjiangensis]|uniref:non-specific serine/threonine protein kinase n=1 Tax=Saccharothrix xinjiangensis TaxID=204798 RepID=A0ABV9XTU3_9PSEU
MWEGDLTGEVVGSRYALGDLYGSGGMAEVYRAFDTRLDRKVAIKFFQGEATPEDRIRLEREAEVLGALRCPGLVEVYDTGVHQGRPYFVMQPVEGGTLRRRMREPLAPAVVAHLGAQVAEVLAHVHANGVVHRDVKPSNILLDTAGRRAYLADFGLALQAQVTRVTRSGVLVGTAGYLSPEQVRGADVSPAADVYALGLVLVECLTGRPEYPGGDTEAALARLHREPRVPTDLPGGFTAALTAMTATDPGRRPSAAECARLLTAAERAAAGLPPLAEAAVEVAPPPAPARRPGVAVLLGGVAVAAASLVLLTLLNPGDPPTGSDGNPDRPATATPSDAPPATGVRPVVDVTTTEAPPAGRATVTVSREAAASSVQQDQPQQDQPQQDQPQQDQPQQDQSQQQPSPAQPSQPQQGQPSPAQPQQGQPQQGHPQQGQPQQPADPTRGRSGNG